MDSTNKKTKIVATLGPASADPKIISDLISAGVNVFRLNFSHGDHETHRKSVDLIRKVSGDMGRIVGILADLQGPKIRCGRTPDDQMIELQEGNEVTLISGAEMCSETRI